jgi:predicted amidohydrolase YtcJ
MNGFVIEIGFSPGVIEALLDQDATRRAAMLIKCHATFDKAVDKAIDAYRKET